MEEKIISGKTSLTGLGLNSIENIHQRMIDTVEDYAIILLDNNGIIQNWNRGAQKIKQYTEQEAVGMHFSVFYMPEDRELKLPERMLHQAGTNGRASLEGWRLRKDGSTFWGSITLAALYDETGNVVGFSKVTRDLTERKSSEDNLKTYAIDLERINSELKKSEERFHRMISEVQDYAIILLDPNGAIRNWNVGAQKIKGYTADEIIGKSFEVFYRPEDQAAGLPKQLLAKAIKEGRATHEGWRLRKDGTQFWGSIVITALHDEDGEIIGFSKVTRDLTERKLAEDKTHQYLMELEHHNRELERFAYIASHDLQEPLRKIRTFIDIIGNNIQDRELITRFFGKITLSADRMSELIKSILNYSRLGKSEDERVLVDLNKELKGVLEDFELHIRQKNAKIRAENLPSITGYPIQISQLFSNLVGNSLKFTSQRPELKITAIQVQSDIIEKFPAGAMAGNYFKITFVDNGIGFEQKYENQIFQLFQRLHRKHEYDGTGIGLALCKRIMDNHGGFITAQGNLGKGARFNLYFPADHSMTKNNIQVAEKTPFAS
jgi:PAS domain S-box-containing protein